MKSSIAIITFFFAIGQVFALSCPEASEISYKNNNWQVPGGWHVANSTGSSMVEFLSSTWIGERSMNRLGSYPPSGTFSCSYATKDFPSGYIVVVNNEPQPLPRSPGWLPMYIKAPLFGLQNYYCYGEKSSDCSL